MPAKTWAGYDHLGTGARNICTAFGVCERPTLRADAAWCLAQISSEAFTLDRVLRFLEDLETTRHNHRRTQNHRLTFCAPSSSFSRVDVLSIWPWRSKWPRSPSSARRPRRRCSWSATKSRGCCAVPACFEVRAVKGRERPIVTTNEPCERVTVAFDSNHLRVHLTLVAAILVRRVTGQVNPNSARPPCGQLGDGFDTRNVDLAVVVLGPNGYHGIETHCALMRVSVQRTTG